MYGQQKSTFNYLDFNMTKTLRMCLAVLGLVMGGTSLSMADDAGLVQALQTAKSIVVSQGTGSDAQSAIEAKGLIDLEGTGQHIFMINPDGKMVFDLSHQTTPGMDMSGILDMEGKESKAYIFDIAKGNNGGFYKSQGSWPHPTKGTMSPSVMYCEQVETAAICAMTW